MNTSSGILRRNGGGRIPENSHFTLFFLENICREQGLSFLGTLTLLSPLPADADFLLTVTASDHGFPVMSSSIPVRVSVTREETQQRPQFLQDSYE